MAGDAWASAASAAESVATVLEMAGMAVIAFGALATTLLFLYQYAQTRAFAAAYHQYRSNLGRAILLGLEFLVAADIVGTVTVAPTYESLGILALIVIIRTFLSFSLQVEIEGRWPWRRSEAVASSARRDVPG